MEKMSRDRRKERARNLGTMRAATPPEDEAMPPVRPMRRMPMEPAPDVAERAMEEVRREREREAMGQAYEEAAPRSMGTMRAKGGKVYAGGGYVKAADGCAQRGKTKGRMI